MVGMRVEESQEYKGYVLTACPIERDPIHWIICVYIEHRPCSKKYQAQKTKLSRDGAVEASLLFGRQIVDRKHPELKLP